MHEFKIGDFVIVLGGFESGIVGTIVANEPTEERPQRFRILVHRREETIGGLLPERIAHACHNCGDSLGSRYHEVSCDPAGNQEDRLL